MKTAQKLFKHCSSRRLKWREFLRRQNCDDVTNPPIYAGTRWNSWFKTAYFWSKHFKHLLNFTIELKADTKLSNKSIEATVEFIKKIGMENLQKQLDFICANTECLVKKLCILESQYCLASETFNIVSDLEVNYILNE